MSEQKMREALELADAALSGANMNMNVVERKVKAALAQPDAVVELTEGELWSLSQRFGFKEKRTSSRHAEVRKGFCLSGSFMHYEVQRSDLVDFARAVIAAHIAKQWGAA